VQAPALVASRTLLENSVDSALSSLVLRRKLNLKAKLESSSSKSSFKRLVPGAINFKHGFHTVNVHRLTLAISL